MEIIGNYILIYRVRWRGAWGISSTSSVRGYGWGWHHI